MFSLISTILGMFVLVTYGFYGFLIGKVISGNLDALGNNYSSHLIKKSMPYLIGFNIGSFAVPAVVYFFCFNWEIPVVHLLLCVKDYIFYSPAYIHTLLIYAFCNGYFLINNRLIFLHLLISK